VLWIVSLWVCYRGTALRLTDALGCVVRPALGSAVAATALLLVLGVLPASAPLVLRLLLDGLVFALAYLGFWVATPGGRRRLATARAALRSAKAGASIDEAKRSLP